MTPQQFKQSLWDCYDHLENISLESTRTTQEMLQGNQVNDYLETSLDALGQAIYLLNHEYFLESIEKPETHLSNKSNEF